MAKKISTQSISELINSVIAGNEKAKNQLAQLIYEVFTKKFQAHKSILKACVGASLEDLICGAVGSFWITLQGNNFSKLKEISLKENSEKEFLGYLDGTAFYMTKKMMNAFSPKFLELTTDEIGDDEEQEDSINRRELKLSLVKNSLSKISSQASVALGAVMDSFEEGGKVQVAEMARKVGMNESQFSRNKHSAIVQMRDYFQGMNEDSLEMLLEECRVAAA